VAGPNGAPVLVVPSSFPIPHLHEFSANKARTLKGEPAIALSFAFRTSLLQGKQYVLAFEAHIKPEALAAQLRSLAQGLDELAAEHHTEPATDDTTTPRPLLLDAAGDPQTGADRAPLDPQTHT